jgi:hypothetical protein
MTEKPSEVRFRLIRADDLPATNPENDAFVFGLQDTKEALIAPARGPNGEFVFDFSLTVKPGADPERPVFGGRFASGPASDRFVYLAWRSVPRGVWINRLKAKLSAIDWAMVHAAQAADAPIEADLSGRPPGSGKTPIPWRIGGP